MAENSTPNRKRKLGSDRSVQKFEGAVRTTTLFIIAKGGICIFCLKFRASKAYLVYTRKGGMSPYSLDIGVPLPPPPSFHPDGDPILTLQKSMVIYKFICPGCAQTYIGETVRCLSFRLNEHGRIKDQPMFRQSDCAQFLNVVSLDQLPEVFGHSAMVNL